MNRQINVLASLFLIGILILLIIALLYAINRSEFYPPGTMEKFYVAFMAGIVSCSLALKLRHDYKVNFVIVILSISAGVYLFEIFLACCTGPLLTNPYAKAAYAAGIPFDLRTRHQVFLDFQAEGVEVYPSANITQFFELVGTGLDEDHVAPLSGMSAITTLVCNESGEYGIYLADEHGFNNPAGLYTASSVDIVLIGDSFTHGHCVTAGQDIASHLRAMGKKTLNLGYGGNGPLMELATLKEYAKPLKPRVVLWLYYEGNDLEDLVVEQQSALLLNYLDKDFSQNLLNRQAEVDKTLRHYLEDKITDLEEKRAADTSSLLNTGVTQVIRLYHLRGLFNRMFALPSPPPPPSPLFEQILREARDQTSSWNGKLYFVYLPAWQRNETKMDEDGELFHRDQVLLMVANLNIPLIDIHEAMSQHPDPLSLFPFRLPGHYVAEGYELTAFTIKTCLDGKDTPRISKTAINQRAWAVPHAGHPRTPLFQRVCHIRP